MSFQKVIFTGTAALLSLSFMMSAAALPDKLHTDNYTDSDSAVRITSNVAKACSGTFGQFTPKRKNETTPGTSDVTWTNVKMLCMGSGDVCEADIYMTKDCTGPVVGKAKLALKNGDASIVPGSVDSHYDISASGAFVKLAYSK